ncbi:uncharacterized protein PF3D7_1120000-like [Argopecten irradians]|uniref:uncharacterized protein PF3D7_1120000-like n=1 Tax=Argopecten irradians TaxID=31199 RepID=UPI00371BFCBB
MASQQKDLTEMKITTSVMQKNWKLLKQIHVRDILDTMIEKCLITIDASREILKKDNESQQAEALLYLIFRKPQQQLDEFMDILVNNGYDFIVEALQEAQAADASNLLDSSLDDRRPKTSGTPLRRNDSGHFHMHRQLSDTTHSERENATRKQFMEEMKAELQQQQTDTMTKQFELLKQHQSEQIARQTQELQRHNADIIRAEFSKLKQSDDQQKETEARIEKLESQLKESQHRLDQERAKMKKETKNAHDKIQEIQRQRDELKAELIKAKREYTDSLKRVKSENLYLRNQIKQDKNAQNQNSAPKLIKNPFTTPLNPKLAQTLENVRNRRR